MDPNNLLTQAAKWRSSDVSANAGGDMDEALGRITAAATIVAMFNLREQDTAAIDQSYTEALAS